MLQNGKETRQDLDLKLMGIERHVAIELVRPQSSRLCHLVCQSAACVAYETRVHDIDELRQRLLYVCHGLEQSLNDDAVDQWPTCLRAYVRANGEHFEHTL